MACTNFSNALDSHPAYQKAFVNTADAVFFTCPAFSELRALNGGQLCPTVACPSANWIDQLVDGDFRPVIKAALRRALAERARFSIECKVRNRDGQNVWVVLAGAPIVVEGEVVGWCGQLTDIDRSRKLIAEVWHRCRNLLAVILVLAKLSIPCSPDRRKFVDRVMALSKAGDILSDHGANGSFHEILQRAPLVTSFMESSQITVQGPNFEFGSRAGVSAQLALHELAINGIKYGSLSSPSGLVTIKTAIDGDRVRVTWCESGGPPVVPPVRSGGGSDLMRCLAFQGDGSVELSFRPSGFECVFELSLSALQA